VRFSVRDPLRLPSELRGPETRFCRESQCVYTLMHRGVTVMRPAIACRLTFDSPPSLSRLHAIVFKTPALTLKIIILQMARDIPQKQPSSSLSLLHAIAAKVRYTSTKLP